MSQPTALVLSWGLSFVAGVLVGIAGGPLWLCVAIAILISIGVLAGQLR